MKRALQLGFLLLSVAGFLSLSGCIRVSTQQGVVNTWRDESCPKFTVGETTQSEVMQALGPPSQILALPNNRLAFYYLREFGQGGAMFFLVYNTGNVHFNYDRAVFFFDEKEMLKDFSISEEEAPRK